MELSDLVARRNIRNLIESGAGECSSGMEAARLLGLTGYTGDIRWKCVQNAFGMHPDFHIYHADSVSMFHDCLPKIDGASFFWLDAHCPTDSGVLPGAVFPLYDELMLIKALKRGYEHDVIWCDDVWMISDPSNPTAAPTDIYLPDADVHWNGDTDHAWEEYLAIFADTHDWSIAQPECVLKLTPKA